MVLIQFRLFIEPNKKSSEISNKMPTSICPECSEEVFVDAETEQGTKVVCDECGASLIVVGLDPIELDLKDDSHGDDLSDSDGLGTYDFEDERY